MQIALTIAGSDSGGGAGVQADLRTFQRFGVFGTSVITAVTAQNTLGVRAVHPVPAEMVQAQLAALAEDLPPAAVKSGMLASAELVLLIADAIAGYDFPGYVLDPVLRAGTGARLLETSAEAALRDRLLPLATLATPNLDEAAALSGFAVQDPPAMERAGRRLLEAGAGAVLVTGGHLPGEEVVDVLVTPAGSRRFAGSRLPGASPHGTGCTLSAAVTAGLALGQPLEQAVERAIGYVRRAIASAPQLGAGTRPLGG